MFIAGVSDRSQGVRFLNRRRMESVFMIDDARSKILSKLAIPVRLDLANNKFLRGVGKLLIERTELG